MLQSIIIITIFLSAITTFGQKDTLQEKNLESLTVVGSRFAQQQKDASHFIGTITASEIQTSNTKTMATLLEQKAGAYVQYSQGGGGSPNLRGFEANKIQLVLDGVRVNNAIFRGGHLQNILRIDQNALQSVEILNGTGAVLYGSDALGGVIAMRTKKPVLSQTSGSGFLRFSSAALEKTGHFDFNIGRKKWASFSSISFSDFGDVRMGENYRKGYKGFGVKKNRVLTVDGFDYIKDNYDTNIQSPSGYSQVNFIEKLLFTTRNVYHVLNFQYATSSLITRYDRLSEIDNRKLPIFTTWNYGPESHLMAAYQAEITKVSRLFDMANISLAFQEFKESRITRKFEQILEKNQKEKVNALSFNTDFKKEFQKNVVQYGLEAVFNTVDSKAIRTDIRTQLSTSAETRYPDGGSNTRNISAYVSFLRPLTSKIQTNVGLRNTFYALSASFKDKTFFNFPFENIQQNDFSFSYFGGLKYFLSNYSYVNFMISTGFRNPNVDDLAKVYESTNGRLVVPNPNIRAENVTNFEINSQIRFKQVQFDFATYFSKYQNMIGLAKFNDFEFDPNKLGIEFDPSLIFASQNLGRSNIIGFQAKITVGQANGLSGHSSINFTKGYYLDKTPLEQIPPMYGRTDINFRRKKLGAELYINYNAAKPLDQFGLNGEDNPQFATKDGSLAWLTLNVKFSYQLKTSWQFQMGLENILDVNYRSFSSGISAPGRNFLVCVRYEFGKK